MKKRIISLLLVLITVLGMFPTAAFAAATTSSIVASSLPYAIFSKTVPLKKLQI